MVGVHRALFDRLGPPPVPAVVLDTPVGFQENAGDVASRAVAYFRESVQRDVNVASWRSVDDGDVLAYETMLAAVRRARYVFAGPGSPSYALRQWVGSQVPALLRDKLEHGGCVTFASAAAVTLGRYAVPVYEIYKVGEAPHWLNGLDLLSALGLSVAVIPHFNNAEGGNHDTRYCYVGERRLRMLEDQLPGDAFVLGVDEHTACILDLAAATVTVAGLGVVTVRHRGVVNEVEAGATAMIDALRNMAASPPSPRASVEAPAARPATGRLATSPLLDDVAGLDADFDLAVAQRDARTAVKAVLELDRLLVDWSRDTLQSDELDRARSVMHSMVVRLGEAAEVGLRDPRQVVAPFVEALVELRRRAREQQRWSDADVIRDLLAGAGVDVHDEPERTTWRLS